ncbi:Alcohol dehydrogenase zinc-binding domain protein [Kribbella flavida DSM 17836]|uniref:Alcohol dehydrogenase zinc-binding domain protein n=1 Tax=Kribbella flavida (strain DSM 17836 / JCM 10339 / NBRC 14399) TaxID=479435 RepID=D2PW49_KRIFD|nr:zinc-binding dehydrogenase [Kribbella flavida]ADB29706.1 Alcohol dehydrogenase zinc-binding domain protein [Kribbella flavida DSM 17836]
MTVPAMMRALVYDPPQSVRMSKIAVPDPGPSDALVAVEYSSLNWVEVARMELVHRPGDVVGRDSAGTVVRAAADGSGPAVGSRVVGFRPGAWAEYQAVGTVDLAVVPGEVDLAAAAALPGAAVSALQAVRRLGAHLCPGIPPGDAPGDQSLEGHRVLVTGASGGVGRAATQLAALTGAEVVAAVGAPERGAGLLELGAAEVVTDLAGVAPVNAVLDMVGGETLTAAYGLLKGGGLALSIGSAGGATSSFDFEAARLRGGRRAVEAFAVSTPFGPDLEHLLQLLSAGLFDPQIGWQGSWHQVDEASTALLGRKVRGKAVLAID